MFTVKSKISWKITEIPQAFTASITIFHPFSHIFSYFKALITINHLFPSPFPCLPGETPPPPPRSAFHGASPAPATSPWPSVPAPPAAAATPPGAAPRSARRPWRRGSARRGARGRRDGRPPWEEVVGFMVFYGFFLGWELDKVVFFLCFFYFFVRGGENYDFSIFIINSWKSFSLVKIWCFWFGWKMMFFPCPFVYHFSGWLQFYLEKPWKT